MLIFATEMTKPSYLHSLAWQGEMLPEAFTYPFRYTPHPLCVRAAAIVQEQLQKMHVKEGKMFGVMVVQSKVEKEDLYFLAAYSGQLMQSYNHPWFVPPIVDYLQPESYFQKEQAEIVALSHRLEALRKDKEAFSWQQRLTHFCDERDRAVQEAKQTYEEGRARRNALREAATQSSRLPVTFAHEEEQLIHESQQQKANIHRAKKLHKEEIETLEAQIAAHKAAIRDLNKERLHRSEALQQWLFSQFVFLNGRGEHKGLLEIFSNSRIPSGAGECCAPKLLQAAYQLELVPLAMAEFWWGPSNPMHYKQPGAFFPACHSKCRPILSHMLQGLNVETDPALHYEQALKPVRIIWEDEHLAVIEKPEGWCSIPGRSDQANLFDEALRLWPGIEGSIIVHRLDQDTSGVIVLAKTARVHRSLSQQFERREVKKRYVALLENYCAPSSSNGENARSCESPFQEGLISLPLAPDLNDMPHQRVDWKHGREAVTQYRIISHEERAGIPVTRFVFHPLTGRTHQLRVHSASPEGLNAPILGDRLYGHIADRLYLHAEAIDFTHPVTGEPLHIEAPCPF